jgi:hypothetical protein
MSTMTSSGVPQHRASTVLQLASLAVILLLLAPRLGQAQWKTEHTILAVSSSLAITTDWFLTANAARRGDLRETNFILGDSPTLGQLTTYNLLALGANVGIGYLLPGKWRSFWFLGVTAFEMAVIQHQVNLGLHINWLDVVH